MFGDRQGAQVDVYVEPIPLKVVAQGTAMLPEPRLASLPQFSNLDLCKGIQRAGNRRLVGKTLAAPSLGQCRIRPQTCVDLRDGTTPSQHADDDILPLGFRRVIDCLQR